MKILLTPLEGVVAACKDGIPVDLDANPRFLISRFRQIASAPGDYLLGDYEGTPCLYIKDQFLSYPHALVTTLGSDGLQIQEATDKVRNHLFVNVDMPTETNWVRESPLAVGDRVRVGQSVFRVDAVTGATRVFARAYPDLAYLGALQEEPDGYSMHQGKSKEGFLVIVEVQAYDGPLEETRAPAEEHLRRITKLRDHQNATPKFQAVTARIYDVRPYEDVGLRYVFMAREPIPAPSLAELALGTDSEPLSVEAAARFGVGLLKALEIFHKFGLHRNLTPRTVHFHHGESMEDDRVVLSGLFWAKPESGGTTMQATAVSEDTPFRPPEQIDHGEYTERSDQYAVALLMAVALTQRPPFAGKRLTEIMQQIMHAKPLLPEDLPAKVRSVLLRGAEKAPQKRFRNLTEFRLQLMKAVGFA